MSCGGAARVARNAPSETTPNRGPRKSRGPLAMFGGDVGDIFMESCEIVFFLVFLWLLV